jgi:hypothetical protein
VTIDDYVQDCNQMKLYHQLRKGGHSNQGLNKNESEEQPCLVTLFNFANVISKYAPRATLTTKVIRLEGEEIFGFYK